MPKHNKKSIFDIKSPEEILEKGSLFGKQHYHQGGGPKDPPADYLMGETAGGSAEDEFIAGDFISGEDMALLQEAGYDAQDLEFMNREERNEALEDAGVDPDIYDFYDD